MCAVTRADIVCCDVTEACTGTCLNTVRCRNSMGALAVAKSAVGHASKRCCCAATASLELSFTAPPHQPLSTALPRNTVLHTTLTCAVPWLHLITYASGSTSPPSKSEPPSDVVHPSDSATIPTPHPDAAAAGLSLSEATADWVSASQRKGAWSEEEEAANQPGVVLQPQDSDPPN